MGKFRRFCRFFYVLATIAAFALLLAPWIGPFTKDTQAFIQVVLTKADVSANTLWTSRIYVFGTLALAAISVLGAIISLGRTFSAPSKNKSVRISRLDGGSITLASDAIVSQVRNVVNAEGSCEVTRVRVTTRGKDHVRLSVNLRPLYPEDVDVMGNRLHNLLQSEISDFTGGALDQLSLHFMRARNTPEEVEEEKQNDAIYVAPSKSHSEDDGLAVHAHVEPAGSNSTTALQPLSKQDLAQPSSEPEVEEPEVILPPEPEVALPAESQDSSELGEAAAEEPHASFSEEGSDE